MHDMGYTEAGVELEAAAEEPSGVRVDRVADVVVFVANGGSGHHSRNLRTMHSVREAVLVAAVLSIVCCRPSSTAELVGAVVLPLPSTLSSLAELLVEDLAEVEVEEDYTLAEDQTDSCSWSSFESMGRSEGAARRSRCFDAVRDNEQNLLA